MNEFLQLDDDLFVMPHAVAMVKRSSIDAESCTVFLKGQSSQDGFVVKMTAEEVVEELEASLSEEE